MTADLVRAGSWALELLQLLLALGCVAAVAVVLSPDARRQLGPAGTWALVALAAALPMLLFAAARANAAL